MRSLIETRALSHVYASSGGADIHALRGVDLAIQQGEFVALIGPNGSGKSTLARHLDALLLPTSGDVWVDGMLTTDRRNLWTIRERVGMVFQNPENQIVGSTVEEDVAFGPENAGLPAGEIRCRVDDALRRVDMTAFARRPPHTLSGGQKQRVAIAGVLAMRPACIILDEPTAMLDPVGQKQTMETLHSLNQEQAIAIILITQSMDEAALAHRVVALADGRVLLDGPPQDVFREVDLLSAQGLGLPTAAVIGDHLRQLGIPVPPTVLTIDQLAAALC
jgi:energy-coupling factor transport system ATP-binding protein